MSKEEKKHTIEFTKAQAKRLLVALKQLRDESEGELENEDDFIEFALELQEISGYNPFTEEG